MRHLLFATALALCGCGDNLAPRSQGHDGTATVAGGVVARSPNYKLIGTLSSNPGTAASARFKKRGGIVGATQAP